MVDDDDDVDDEEDVCTEIYKQRRIITLSSTRLNEMLRIIFMSRRKRVGSREKL